LKVIQRTKSSDIAAVYIAQTGDGHMVEFVESSQPPFPRSKKWVLIISSLIGCPVQCRFCEAGGSYKRVLSKEELYFQIRYVLDNYCISRYINSEKFKIQFARIGEPSLNDNVLLLLEELPSLIDAPGLLPCISTVAPRSADRFFESLLAIKNELYKNSFQLQFSVHSTDEDHRNYLLPVSKWSLEEISDYGRRFYSKQNRKITLNFAPSGDTPLCPDKIRKCFSPEIFLLKFTPINPTLTAKNNRMDSLISPRIKKYDWIDRLRCMGYEVILSIGEMEENRIGSNCGQYISNFRSRTRSLKDAYTYELEDIKTV